MNKKLYVATDLDRGNLLGAVLAMSEDEAYEHFSNRDPMIPEQNDRLCVEPVENSGYSIDDIKEEFPKLFEECLSEAASEEPSAYEMIAARALHFMRINCDMEYIDIASELGIDVQDVLNLIGPDSYDDKDIMLESADKVNGVRTVTVHNDTSEKVVLEFKTFEEAVKHFDDLYANAVEESYAEEVLYPILCAARNKEYDYIDADGFAVIEVDATGVFDNALNDIWDDDEIKEDCKAVDDSHNLKESYRRIVSRGKSLDKNELFVDFD